MCIFSCVLIIRKWRAKCRIEEFTSVASGQRFYAVSDLMAAVLSLILRFIRSCYKILRVDHGNSSAPFLNWA